MGVVSAILKFAGADLWLNGWNTPLTGGASPAEMVAIVPFLLLCIYMVIASMKYEK